MKKTPILNSLHPRMKLGKIPILGEISILSQKEEQGCATIAKVGGVIIHPHPMPKS